MLKYGVHSMYVEKKSYSGTVHREREKVHFGAASKACPTPLAVS